MRISLVPWPAAKVIALAGGLALLAVLQGCANAPGMRMAKAEPTFKEAISSAYGVRNEDSYGAVALMCKRSEHAQTNPTTVSLNAATAPAKPAATYPSSTPTSYQLQPITWDLIAAQKQTAPDVLESARKLVGTPQPYRIGMGDVLAVAVWEHPELGMGAMGGATTVGADTSGGQGYLVNNNGDIQFPYLGKFRVGGLTEAEAHTALTKALGKIIRNPQITVRVQNYRSQRVYVDGDIKTPGVYSVTDLPMTLPEAINRAGGALPTADLSRLQLNRNGATYTINMPALVASGINPNNVLLTGGDMLRIPAREESKVYLIGEVTKPLALPLVNGRMTLNAALGEAAGVSPVTGNGRQVYVIRTRADAATGALPAVYHLDAKSPTALILAEQFELQAKDVVYVDAAPLATWNRVISLILPSAALLSTGKTITNN